MIRHCLAAVESVPYIPMSALREILGLDETDWEIIFMDAPFTWGDCEMSLVKASRIAQLAKYRLYGEVDHVPQLLKTLYDLGDTLIYLDD
jgi:hypothetical protein